ncbi:MAG: hypothetical protein ACTHU0_08915 [Kofleriaceae bacterium]
MKLVRTFSTILALASAPVAYAQAPATPSKAPTEPKAPTKTTPPKGEELSTADAEQVLSFVNQFADAVESGKDSCAKMATAINAVVDKNAPFLRKAKQLKNQGKTLPKETETKMTTRTQEVIPVLMKCKDDKAVEAALMRMDDPDAKPAPSTPSAPSSTSPPAGTPPTSKPPAKK